MVKSTGVEQTASDQRIAPEILALPGVFNACLSWSCCMGTSAECSVFNFWGNLVSSVRYPNYPRWDSAISREGLIPIPPAVVVGTRMISYRSLSIGEGCGSTIRYSLSDLSPYRTGDNVLVPCGVMKAMLSQRGDCFRHLRMATVDELICVYAFSGDTLSPNAQLVVLDGERFVRIRRMSRLPVPYIEELVEPAKDDLVLFTAAELN